MPFQFDLSQVFWGLMNKTMWDCRFGNMNGFNGFNGGFMNSCWGGGFQMPAWGDSYNFSSTSGGSSSSTIEDEVEKRGLTRKQNTLYKLLEDYAKSLPEGTERDTLEVTLNKHKSVKQGNYDALQALYEENKTKIQKKFNNGTKIEVSAASKTAATDFARTNTDFKSILKVDSENKTESQLKDGVDAMEFLYSLQTTKKKSFKALYEDAGKNADDTKKAEMKKVLEAVYKDLTKTALEVKKDNTVSEDTKASIGKLLEIAETSATPENVDQLYCWIRLAKAEIADNKYASLQEDFPDDPLLGKVNGVASTTAALEAEGLDVENIKKQTASTDFSGLENDDQRMTKLENAKIQTRLDATQMDELKKLPGVKKFLEDNQITKVWVDSTPQSFGQMFIRVIDKDGNLKCLTGVAAEKDANGNITFKSINQPLVGGANETGKIAFGTSITFEEIEAQSAMVEKVKAQIGKTLTECSKKSNGQRVFEEKIATGSRKRKRLFVISRDGNLKEWQNMWYVPQKKEFYHNTTDATPEVDADLENIKKDVEEANNKKLPENQSAKELLTNQKYQFVSKYKYSDGTCTKEIDGEIDLSTLYDDNIMIELKNFHDEGMAETVDWNNKNHIARYKSILDNFDEICSSVEKALIASGLEEPYKLRVAVQTVKERYKQLAISITDDSSASNGGEDTIREIASHRRGNKEGYENKQKGILKVVDWDGLDSVNFCISFKDLVDDILAEYKSSTT